MGPDKHALDRLRILADPSPRVADEQPRGTARAALWLAIGVVIGASAAVGGARLWRPALFAGGASVPTPAPALAGPGPAQSNLSSILSSSGYIIARRKTTVAASVTGRLQKLLVKAGDTVVKGQVLARLEDSAELARLESAKSQIKSADSQQRRYELEYAQQGATHRRTLELKEQGMVSPAKVEDSALSMSVAANQVERGREDVTQAHLNLDLAATSLDLTYVRAPFGGVVVELNAQEGEVVSPASAAGGFIRTGICTIVDMQSLIAEVEVNEKFLKDIYIGQKLHVTPDAYADLSISGTVVEVSKQVDRAKGTVMVRAELDALDKRILPDMAVRASLERKRAP